MLKEFKIHTKDYLHFLETSKAIKNVTNPFLKPCGAIYFEKIPSHDMTTIWTYQLVLIHFLTYQDLQALMKTSNSIKSYIL